MSIELREQQASSRILIAAELLAARFKIPVPGDLRSVSGGPIERGIKRSEAFAQLLENVVLEDINPGLSIDVKGFTSISVLRSTADEDLVSQLELPKATIKKLRAGLKAPRYVRVEAGGEPVPSSDETLAELSEDEDAGGDK